MGVCVCSYWSGRFFREDAISTANYSATFIAAEAPSSNQITFFSFHLLSQPRLEEIAALKRRHRVTRIACTISEEEKKVHLRLIDDYSASTERAISWDVSQTNSRIPSSPDTHTQMTLLCFLTVYLSSSKCRSVRELEGGLSTFFKYLFLFLSYSILYKSSAIKICIKEDG